MNACFPNPTYRRVAEYTAKRHSAQSGRRPASSDVSVRNRSVEEDAYVARGGFHPAPSGRVRNDLARAAGPWFVSHHRAGPEGGDYVLQAEKLPLQLRIGVILCGALLGWAVPIAIATRFL